MQSLWDERQAAQFEGPLAQRVYTSRLLGRDRSLVLHGGGNTSVKIRQRNLIGEEEWLLYVKGSGWDLETIEPQGFAPVRMKHLLGLSSLPRLDDTAMARELRAGTVDPGAPAPSVESILHAILPAPFVDHTHADAIVAITNTPDGRERIRDLYGDLVVIVPYVMPGFDLARVCADLYPAESGPATIGMVLLKHGIFTFGETARESYERMIDLVDRAERYLADRGAWAVSYPAAVAPKRPVREELAVLRREVSVTAGFPVVLSMHADDQTLTFARRDDVGTLSQQGPITPDHVIRTKRIPMFGRDVEAYASAYRRYFDEFAAQARQPLTMLDPAPRVVLDPELGLLAVGRTAKDAAIVEEIYRHTMDVLTRSSALGGYEALSAREIFEVEYWDLEQAKLRKPGTPPVFTGEIALVTGAASGIGRACVDAFLARGAAVVGLDLQPGIADLYTSRPDVLGLCCDIADPRSVADSLEQAVRRFGGVDMLVLNAGVFPTSRRVAEMPLDEWDQVMRVNLDANVALLREAHPLLKQAPGNGRVVVVGSKNVPAPGPGAAAYSASKAALTQLARVTALEWGHDLIRVNVVHPNMVFDTGIWTDEVLASRAAQYGLSVDEYRTNNVLRTEVRSRDVASLVAELCGPVFSRTTGAQIPIDGGNERVI